MQIMPVFFKDLQQMPALKGDCQGRLFVSRMECKMSEKSMTLKCLELEDEIMRLRRMLNDRAEAYMLLGQKVDMWRAAAERCDTEAKMWKAEADRYREELGK